MKLYNCNYVAKKKKSTKIWFILLSLLTIFFSGCHKLLVEPDPNSSAEKNFEIFWSDIYNTYPYFEKDKINWQEVYNQYRPQVTPSTTDVQLFSILRNMLSLLSDQHKSLISADKKLSYQSVRPNYYTNYDSNHVMKAYLDNKVLRDYAADESTQSQTDVVSDYGITSDSILYYHIRTYYTEYSFENSFNLFSRQHPGSKGLILDLRNNTGGRISTLLKFMSVFFDKPTDYIIMRSKSGPLEGDFAPPENFTIRPSAGIPIFKKPIVVLTNRYTISAAEHTVLAMRLRNNTTIVGDTTYGAFSFVLTRTLPNGMQFECVSTQATDINGNNYENIGVPPQEYAILTQATYSKGRDDLMDKALQLLK